MKKQILAGVLGGVAMFLASAFTHTVLPLDEAGIRSLPQEEPVLAALKEHVREPGFYLFPGMAQGAAPEQRRQWEERYRSGPVGVLVYQPAGGPPMFPRQLGIECLSNILAALIAAWLLAQTRLTGYGNRVLFVAALGLAAGLAIDVSHWNWYGFPTSFMLASMADQIISFAAAGLVLARLVKSCPV